MYNAVGYSATRCFSVGLQTTYKWLVSCYLSGYCVWIVRLSVCRCRPSRRRSSAVSDTRGLKSPGENVRSLQVSAHRSAADPDRRRLHRGSGKMTLCDTCGTAGEKVSFCPGIMHFTSCKCIIPQRFAFLARDSIYAIARYMPSPVRPSVTRVDQSKTLEVRITQPSPQSSPMTLVS